MSPPLGPKNAIVFLDAATDTTIFSHSEIERGECDRIGRTKDGSGADIENNSY